MKNSNSNQKNLKDYLENKVIKTAKGLKGKFLPISEIVDKVPKVLRVSKVFVLGDNLKNLYLLIVKNHSKETKVRYFLAILLASQSSDLLVSLAMDFSNENNLKLIQYSIISKSPRINLISLKEIEKVEDYSNSIDLLNNFRKQFRQGIIKIKNIVKDQ